MTEQARQLRCFRSSFLHLMILPTESCNFRCTYCYETFENRKMQRGVVDGIKSLIERRAGDLEELEIGWFGGEPLLAFDIVTEISEHAMKLSSSNGFRFTSNMTTNAYYLDRPRFLTCLDHGVGTFQITLDGEPDVHNSSRKLANGNGTFDRIWSNLMAMKEVPGEFTILLRLHFTYENFLSIGEFARHVNNVFGGDPRFQIMFRGINRWGGPNDENITPLSDEEQHEIENLLLDAIGLRPSHELHEESYVCYAAKGNSLVIRSTGRLAKCTVALSDDFNDIGTIMENGDICVDQQKFRRWVSPALEGRWEEAKCPLNWVASEADLDAAPVQTPLLTPQLMRDRDRWPTY